MWKATSSALIKCQRRGDEHLWAEEGQEGHATTNTWHTCRIQLEFSYQEWHSYWKRYQQMSLACNNDPYCVQYYFYTICSLSLFVLCDRIGADSLSLLFSQTSLGCLSLNLCCAVAYYDSGVIWPSTSLPYIRTKLVDWVELCCVLLIDCSLFTNNCLMYLKPTFQRTSENILHVFLTWSHSRARPLFFSSCFMWSFWVALCYHGCSEIFQLMEKFKAVH